MVEKSRVEGGVELKGNWRKLAKQWAGGGAAGGGVGEKIGNLVPSHGGTFFSIDLFVLVAGSVPYGTGGFYHDGGR